ncbi:MAG: D-2-hydroxyacid dehydrogenase [Gemmataceae bacterium]|nr:D-2-hydroxyacid dehydrogenase [Gemmataceae bacterium]
MRIVVLDGHTLAADGNSWAALEQLGEVEIHDRSSTDEVLPRALRAEVLITNKARVQADVIEQAAALQFIAVSATGHDCVDSAAACRKAIPVSNVPEYGTDSVAQFTFALLLELCHRVGLHTESVKGGEWSRSLDWCFWKSPQVELRGKAMGIIGFGRIGRRVGELAHAFGMRVLATGRPLGSPPAYQPFAWVGLDELLAQADVISLHCPMTTQTAGLVNRDRLGRVQPGAFLINTSRGGLVVEDDLADALNRGMLAAAAVDVVSREPIRADNPLLAARNCLITPHIAWSTREARRRLLDVTVANVANFLRGSPTNVVNGAGVRLGPTN